jgi:predicted nucleic acid-binding protein
LIVIDASALVKALIERTASGDAVRERIKDETLTAPAHVDAEVLSVLRGLVLGGKLPADRARIALGLLEVMPLKRVPLPPYLDRGWRLRGNHSAYGALYIAIAETAKCPLVTSDARIAKAGAANCPIEAFT